MEEVLANLLLSHAPLAALVGQSVDWDESPQGAADPRITMVLVSSLSGLTYQGVDGLTRSRVQFDCHASTPKEARQVARVLADKLNGFRGVFEGVRFQGIFKVSERSQSGKDGPRKWAIASIDFFIWSAAA